MNLSDYIFFLYLYFSYTSIYDYIIVVVYALAKRLLSRDKELRRAII